MSDSDTTSIYVTPPDRHLLLEKTRILVKNRPKETADAFVGDRARVQHFLENVPSRWVTRELRRVRHRNRQQQWQRGDLNDVNALSVATPYCDVVVTERQWARHLNHEGLAEKYGTVVIHDLTELPSLLAAAPTT